MTGPDKTAQAFGTQAISIRIRDHPNAHYMCRDLVPGKTLENNDLNASSWNWASPIV